MNSTSLRAPSATRCLVLGVVAGAVFGWLEARVHLANASDEAVVRRAASLTLYATGWSALVAAAAFSVAGVLARRARLQRWRVAREGATPVFLATLFALAWPAATTLLLTDAMMRHSRTIRVFVLLLSCVAAGLSAWLLARRLADRPGRRTTEALRALSRPAPGLALVALLVAAGLTLPVAGAPEVLAVDDQVPPRVSATPDVLLVAIDGLRQDVLDHDGGWGASTPTLDALVARGTSFEDVLAPSPFASTSLASLFDSIYPFEHGVHPGGPPTAITTPTIASELAASGLRSLGAGGPACSSLHTTPPSFEVLDLYAYELEERFLAARLFDRALRLFGLVTGPRRLVPCFESSAPFVGTRVVGEVEPRDVNERLETWAWPGDESASFLFVHYARARADAEHAAIDEDRRARYRREVEAIDTVLGELLARLARTRRLEETWIVVTGTSGHELGAGVRLSAAALDVPLVVAGPGVPAGRVVSGRASLLDVAPTLAELCGRRPAAAFRGRSLVPLFAPEPDWVERPAFAEAAQPVDDGGRSYAAAIGNWKLILDADGMQVFDLANDPREERPSDAVPPVLEPVARALEAFAAFPRRAGGYAPNASELAALELIAEDPAGQ